MANLSFSSTAARVQRGAAFSEYVIALVFLLGIFVVGGLALQVSARSGADRSIHTVQGMVPCDQDRGGRLDDGAGECL